MNELKLNLGRFNQCVEYLSDGQNAAYSLGPGSKIFHYIGNDGLNHDGNVTSVELTGDCIHIPTLVTGSCVSNGRISDQQVLNLLLSRIELNIFAMIQRILQESDNDSVRLEKILIPVHSVEVFDDNKCDGCYGWAKMGVAVVITEKDAELVSDELTS